MLEAPEPESASEFPGSRRGPSASSVRRARRDFSDGFEDDFSDDDVPRGRRRGGLHVRFRGGLPRTRWGRIATAVVLLLFVGMCAGAAMIARSAVLHDDRFVIPASSSIEIQGNEHVTRAQLLSVFGEDVERNIFTVPLETRKAELEELPWVEHATVMRLLPNRLRVSVVERKPVAFVRQGNHIGLVDANGVLLDMPTDVQANMHYSFPVITGIAANDPASLRAARMKIYARFTGDLDSTGENISRTLSEVDLSNPEDVRALIPDHGTEVLVHFGEDNFLDRYKKFEEHLPEWRTQYPKLSSVDMRYERQVVLEMQPGSTVPLNADGQAAMPGNGATAVSASAAQDAGAKKAAPAGAAHPAVAKAASVKKSAKVAPHRVAGKGKGVTKHVPAKSPLGNVQYHPPQVVHP